MTNINTLIFSAKVAKNSRTTKKNKIFLYKDFSFCFYILYTYFFYIKKSRTGHNFCPVRDNSHSRILLPHFFLIPWLAEAEAIEALAVAAQIPRRGELNGFQGQSVVSTLRDFHSCPSPEFSGSKLLASFLRLAHATCACRKTFSRS